MLSPVKFFFLVPILLMIGYSVMPRGTYGGVGPGFTLEHYARFFDPLYLAILGRTVVVALLCTALCLLLGYPVAWVIARSRRWRNLLILLVVLPFWTSFLVPALCHDLPAPRYRTHQHDVPVARADRDAADAPLHAVRGSGGHGLQLPAIHDPPDLNATLEKLDPALLEAASVLGARPAARFRRVVLPLSMPGVVAGCLLVFIPALGSFLRSDLLGGAKQMLIGNLIQNQFAAARHWPFGSAASAVVMAGVLVGVLLYLRSRDRPAPAMPGVC